MTRVSKTQLGRRTFLKTAGGTALGGLVAGCVGGGIGGGGGPTELTIAIPHFGFNWDTSMPFIVGKDQGFFEDEGLNMSKVQVGGGGKNVRAVVAGDAQIALGTGVFAIMSAYRQGSGIRMVSNEVAAATDLFWVSKKGSKFTSKEDLKGTSGVSLGYSSPGSSTNMVAQGAINALNLDGSEAVAVGGPPESLAAVKTGEVDLSWITPEFLFDPETTGVQMVFHGSSIPPFGNITIRANLAEQTWLQNNGDTAEAYFTAYKTAMDWAYDNADEAAKILGERFDVENAVAITKEFLEAGAYAREALRLDNVVNVDEANELAVKNGFIDSKLSTEEMNEMIDTSYLPTTDGDTFS